MNTVQLPLTPEHTVDAMLKAALLFGLSTNPRLFDLVDMDPFLLQSVRHLASEGLVALAEDRYALTAKGVAHLNQVRDLAERIIDLRILRLVDIGRLLDPSTCDENGVVFANLHDPRFLTDDQYARLNPVAQRNIVDLRICVFEYLNATLGGQVVIDPHFIVFMNRVIGGEYAPADLYRDLLQGTNSRLYREIDEVVRTAYRLPFDGENAPEQMIPYWYGAAMHELVKRKGHRCTACQQPLGVYEAMAREERKQLTECPHCGANFKAPPTPAVPDSVYDEHCPNCGTGIMPHHNYCNGCQARIDRRYAEGTSTVSLKSETFLQEEVAYYPTVVAYSPNPYAVVATWAMLAIVL